MVRVEFNLAWTIEYEVVAGWFSDLLKQPIEICLEKFNAIHERAIWTEILQKDHLDALQITQLITHIMLHHIL